jgi:hypothetical protein
MTRAAESWLALWEQPFSARLTLAKMANGEFVPNSLFLPSGMAPTSSVSLSPQRAVTFQDLLDGCLPSGGRLLRQSTNGRGSSRTRKVSRRDRRSPLTPDNLVEWKRSIVSAGLRAKTIQGSKLSPVRAILRWGVQNKLLSLNAVEGISLDVKSKHSERKRSFTDEDPRLSRTALFRAPLGRRRNSAL